MDLDGPDGHRPELDRARRRRIERDRARRRRTLVLTAAAAIAVIVAGVIALGLSAGSGGGDTGSSGRPVAGGTTGSATRGRSKSSTASRTAKRAGHHNDAGVASLSPAHRDLGPPGQDAVPILMYHVIAEPPQGAPFPGLYVGPQEFTEQMLALKRGGWHAVTPDQVEAYWMQGRPLGAGRPIVVSFDNGYQSQFTQALPVLRQLGWVAEENLQLTGLPPSQGGLSQREIRGLIAAGWELDTQGFSHADLITLDAQQLNYQVAVSRRTLQHRYGVPVNWFCYPSGHYDPTVVAAVKAAGYTGSTTVVPGWAHRNDDPYRLHRLRVLRGTTGSQLLALLAGIREDPPAPASYPPS